MCIAFGSCPVNTFEKFHCFQDYEAKNYSIVLEPERFLEVWTIKNKNMPVETI